MHNLPHWYLISRFQRNSISWGVMFAILTGKKGSEFRDLSVLNLILFSKSLNFKPSASFAGSQ